MDRLEEMTVEEMGIGEMPETTFADRFRYY